LEASAERGSSATTMVFPDDHPYPSKWRRVIFLNSGSNPMLDGQDKIATWKPLFGTVLTAALPSTIGKLRPLQ